LLHNTLSGCVRCSVDARDALHFFVVVRAHCHKVSDVCLVDGVVDDVNNRVDDVFGLELAGLDDTLERRVSSLFAYLGVVGRIVVVVYEYCVTTFGEDGDVDNKVHDRSVSGLWKNKRKNVSL
jgi:hypothetical protein